MQVTPGNGAGLAIDPKATEQLSALAKSDPKAAVRQVAGQFEAILLNQMMATMRENSFDEESSSELGTFRGMLDQQLVSSMVQQGGTGLADMLARQIETLKNPDSTIKPMTFDGGLPPLPPAAARALNKYRQQAVDAPALVPVAASTATSIPTNRQGFIDALLPFAENAAKRLGVAPELLVGHAALESGWGRRSLRHADGRDSYNLFGIKATPAWQGDSVASLTTEYVAGKPNKQVENFRAYPSIQAAFDDYASLLLGNGRYKQALNQGSNAHGFASALQQGGYATDPVYAQKLASVANTLLSR